MKRSVLILLTISTFLISCQKNQDKEYQEKIIGEWAFERKVNLTKNLIVPPPPGQAIYHTINFVFENDGKYINKTGFYRSNNAKKREDIRSYFLGTKSTFDIKRGNLLLQNLSTEGTDTFKIKEIKNDSLVFQISDSLFLIYKKVTYNEKRNLYDRIIISSEGCLGTCPRLSFSFDNLGNVLFSGKRFTTRAGYFTAQMDSDLLNNALSSFRKFNLDNLKNEYYGADDAPTYSISFIKDGKIVKTVVDVGNEAPSIFIGAYFPLLYAYQKLNLKPINVDNNYAFFNYFVFETTNEEAYLRHSESFFLITELTNSKKSRNTKFHEKYFISWLDNDVRKRIKTDGRYFKFPDGTVYDLGYNFLERNNLNTRFEERSY